VEENAVNMMEYYKHLEEEFRAIFDYSYDGIFISDGDGKVVRINKSCEIMEGIKSSNVVGKSLEQLLDEGYYNNSVTLEVLKKKIPITQLQIAKNGRRLMCTGVPIFQNGRIQRVVINSRDISELTLLEKELQETRIHSGKLQSRVEILEKKINLDNYPVFKSTCMQNIMNTIVHIAEFDSTLLLTGESGVGKEMIARLVHKKSKRNKASFVKVDCSAIPASLFESELFGYDKGAFTGAERQGKIGLLELADKGTLLIDEVGELPLGQQVKLLRFIQDREIIKVGGKKTISVDTRIIAATNRNLLSMVEAETFRKDLYYRLNVIPIVIPPLRDRKDDIFVLIQFFLDKFNKEFGIVKALDKESLEILEEYRWPGNVRELENIIERLIVLSSGKKISKNDLPGDITEYRYFHKLLSEIKEEDTYRTTLFKVERELLMNAMGKSQNLREMSKILGLDKSSISRKLKKHKILLTYR
jgi:PAS domain S-box-containing protein